MLHECTGRKRSSGKWRHQYAGALVEAAIVFTILVNLLFVAVDMALLGYSQSLTRYKLTEALKKAQQAGEFRFNPWDREFTSEHYQKFLAKREQIINQTTEQLLYSLPVGVSIQSVLHVDGSANGLVTHRPTKVALLLPGWSARLVDGGASVHNPFKCALGASGGEKRSLGLFTDCPEQRLVNPAEDNLEQLFTLYPITVSAYIRVNSFSPFFGDLSSNVQVAGFMPLEFGYAELDIPVLSPTEPPPTTTTTTSTEPTDPPVVPEDRDEPPLIVTSPEQPTIEVEQTPDLPTVPGSLPIDTPPLDVCAMGLNEICLYKDWGMNWINATRRVWDKAGLEAEMRPFLEDDYVGTLFDLGTLQLTDAKLLGENIAILPGTPVIAREDRVCFVTTQTSPFVGPTVRCEEPYGACGFSCSRVPGKGCFAAGTRLLTDSGYKAIELLTPKDLLVNPENGRFQKVKRLVHGPEKEPLVRFTLRSGKIVEVTKGHPMATTTGMLRADQLTLATFLLTSDGPQNPVSIEFVESDVDSEVFNVELDVADPSDRLFVAEGFYSGDLAVQNSLSE